MPFTNNNDILDQPVLFAGQCAYTQDGIIRTYFNAETSAVIPFGYGVVLGTTTAGSRDFMPARLPSATGQRFIGVAAYDNTYEKRSGTAGTDDLVTLTAGNLFGAPPKEALGIVRRDVVAVYVANAVTPDSTVHLIHTTSGDAIAGMFRSNNTNADAVTGAVFLESGSAGDIVRLALNLP